MTADAWGVDDGYVDANGSWQPTPPATVEAIHRAMGADGAGPPAPAVRVAHPGEQVATGGPALLTLEDGTELDVDGTIPPDLPLGYHDLRRVAADEVVRLIISPGRGHVPDDLRAWGLAVQLYAARSTQSWGMGDLADLRQLIDWTAGQGAGVLAVNPLHAALPLAVQQPSPYYPSSRRWDNPLYLRIEEVPGAAELDELPALAAAGMALNADRRIDRDAVYRLKLDALERLWRRFPGDPAFDRFLDLHGDDLRSYATFCALAEHHGTGWSQWPVEHRSPQSPAVDAFAGRHADRLRFHGWLQWLLDGQLAAAGADDMLLADVAVGIDPNGADAWAWQEVLALDMRVGAPPDLFNTQGQDWGLPPFIPWRLQQARYEPFVRTIRSGLRRAHAMRIDHVMGLFRLFWIPPDGGPANGTYVRFAGRELLDILTLESVRARTLVVGEDLGTVEDDVRARLGDAGVLSYRLMLFESDRPSHYPRQALAAITTHDLPTIAGVWSGTDLDAQRTLGLRPNEEGTAQMRAQLSALTGTDDTTPVEEVIVAAHVALAEAPSMIVTATLDDALAVEERPNMPGTVDEWPNWSIALPCPIEEIPGHPLARHVIEEMAGTRPRTERSTGQG